MYIHEVMATGKPYRRAKWHQDSQVNNDTQTLKFTKEDLRANDWEVVKPKSAVVTEEKLLYAFQQVYGPEIDWRKITAFKVLCKHLGLDV